MPTVEYAYSAYSGSEGADDIQCVADANTHVDNVTTLGASSGGMCREVWELTLPGSACVKFEGSLQRYFDTGDSAADLVLTYRDYQMHA